MIAPPPKEDTEDVEAMAADEKPTNGAASEALIVQKDAEHVQCALMISRLPRHPRRNPSDPWHDCGLPTVWSRHWLLSCLSPMRAFPLSS